MGLLRSCFSPGPQYDAAETALRTAAARGDVDGVKAALKRGAHVDCRSDPDDPDTPLFAAVLLPETETAQVLLKAGASVHARNSHGQTPLMLSCLRENAAPMVQLLLNASADPRARSTVDGRTALHNAAEYGDEPSARALLAGGAAVDARTVGGATPAQLALLRRGTQAQAIVCLLSFWAADMEAANAAKLRLGGPGSSWLGAAGRDNCASTRGGGSASGRAFSMGGSRGAAHCSTHGSSRGGPNSVHGEGLSNHPMMKQHGSHAAMLMLDAGAKVAVPV